ncbi:MAG: hypothetical protein ABJC88_16975 [Parasphingorhabdus sp.]|uniref:hypothetical protein n=1 Tax=Sphingomonadales TaxID=204457 RepID=UPI003266AD75
MKVGQFAIIDSWHAFEVVEITMETPKQIRCIQGNYERRIDKAKVRAVFDNEDSAEKLINKLVSAKAEMHRRTKSARDWYSTQVGKLLLDEGEA